MRTLVKMLKSVCLATILGLHLDVFPLEKSLKNALPCVSIVFKLHFCFAMILIEVIKNQGIEDRF